MTIQLCLRALSRDHTEARHAKRQTVLFARKAIFLPRPFPLRCGPQQGALLEQLQTLQFLLHRRLGWLSNPTTRPEVVETNSACCFTSSVPITFGSARIGLDVRSR